MTELSIDLDGVSDDDASLLSEDDHSHFEGATSSPEMAEDCDDGCDDGGCDDGSCDDSIRVEIGRSATEVSDDELELF